MVGCPFSKFLFTSIDARKAGVSGFEGALRFLTCLQISAPKWCSSGVRMVNCLPAFGSFFTGRQARGGYLCDQDGTLFKRQSFVVPPHSEGSLNAVARKLRRKPKLRRVTRQIPRTVCLRFHQTR